MFFSEIFFQRKTGSNRINLVITFIKCTGLYYDNIDESMKEKDRYLSGSENRKQIEISSKPVHIGMDVNILSTLSNVPGD